MDLYVGKILVFCLIKDDKPRLEAVIDKPFTKLFDDMVPDIVKDIKHKYSNKYHTCSFNSKQSKRGDYVLTAKRRKIPAFFKRDYSWCVIDGVVYDIQVTKDLSKGDLPEVHLIEQNSYVILYIEMEDQVWRENYLKLK